MDISPNTLRKELVATLKEVNKMLDEPDEDTTNRSALLLAKAECLNALVTLRDKR